MTLTNSKPNDSSPAPLSIGTASFARFFSEYLLTQEYERYSAESAIFHMLKTLHQANLISIDASRNPKLKHVESEELDAIINIAKNSFEQKPENFFFTEEDDLSYDFDRLTKEMVYCKIINIFLIYISDISIEILKISPRTISSSETMKVEEIVKYGSIDELIQSIIERKINDLSYAGVIEISNYISSRFGLQLFKSDNEAERVRRFIEIRNLYTHNNGVVNSIFKKKNPELKIKIGSYVPATRSLIGDASLSIQSIVMRFDKAAQEKFGIPGVQIDLEGGDEGPTPAGSPQT